MRRASRESGVALLLALLVLTILILLVGQMAISGAHNRSVSRNATATLQNEYAVLAGYRQALVRIEEDRERTPDADALDDLWNPPFTFTLGTASVTGRIVDAERRFNLSSLVNADGEVVPEAKEQLVRLLQVLGHETAENADRIVDYVDTDTKGAFEAGARNAPLLNLQELQRIEGLKREVLFGDGIARPLLPFLTVWPKKGESKLNPNTAPVEVLQSLDADMTAERAQAIVTWRSAAGENGAKKAFKTIDDVKQVTELPAELVTRIAPRLVFKSGAFEIRVHATCFAVERKELFVVGWKTSGEGADAESRLELLGSMREHEYFDLKPTED